MLWVGISKIYMGVVSRSKSDVEAAMLLEVGKVNKYRDLQGLLINQIQKEYAKTPKGRAAR